MAHRSAAAAALVLTMATSACMSNTGAASATVLFRVDVTIMDNGHERQGSGVWSSTLSKPAMGLASPYNSRFDAEAIPIPLGGQNWVFVLPGTLSVKRANVTAAQWPERIFGLTQIVRGSEQDGILALSNLSKELGRSVLIKCNEAKPSKRYSQHVECPSLAFSDDISDPRTFWLIDKLPNDKFASRNIDIVSIRVTITEAGVTRRLSKMLPWLSAQSYFYSKSNPESYEFEQSTPRLIRYLRLQ